MASLGVNSTNGQSPIVSPDTAKPQTEPKRSLANFPPSIWGNRFISFSLDHSALESYARSMGELTEEVRRLIVDPTIGSTQKLKIIYSVDRLGLSYLFAYEIENMLDKLFKELNLHDYEGADLHTVSVHFQVFRDHGYKLPCDVFNKFKDNTTGGFKEYITSDVMGMLGLYECTPLRIRGEDVLEEALAFTETRLKNIASELEGNLARQVKQALKRPSHLGMPLVEARLYVTTYEEESTRDESLLNLAKVHLNYLQLLHKEELRVVSKWWNDLKFQSTLPYIRDRATESYFWALGTSFEPCYTYGRIIGAKTLMLIQVLDDTSDAYSTIEEMRLLTDAMNRWEYSAVDQLPEYMKPFYKVLLNMHDELEKQQTKEGRAYSVLAWKRAFQELAGGYLQEAEWQHGGKVPSFPDYLKNGSITSTYNLAVQAALVGMGPIANEQVFAWYEARPKFLQATEVAARLINDLRTFQFERRRGQSAAGVDAYMKEYGVSEEVAIQEIDKLIQNGFKDVNEGCLKPTALAMPLLAPVRNLTKMLDVAYKYDDGYTFPEKNLQELITLLFVTPAPSHKLLV